ncbi:MAG: hypothetical protein Q9227_007581 [Pyrenula ochraceoflavens]
MAFIDQCKIVIVLVFGLPESPRQLYKYGKHDEALQVLCDVYDREPNDPMIVRESDEILQALAVETKHGEYQWKNIFKKDENFFVVMITPTIINNLQWKAYLIFMCTSYAFVPLIYFCYPETAELSLEEIDFLFTEEGVNPVAVSKRIRKERRKGGRRVSIVGNRGSISLATQHGNDKDIEVNGDDHGGAHIEKL